jgi:hypothetical protein
MLTAKTVVSHLASNTSKTLSTGSLREKLDGTMPDNVENALASAY